MLVKEVPEYGIVGSLYLSNIEFVLAANPIMFDPAIVFM